MTHPSDVVGRARVIVVIQTLAGGVPGGAAWYWLTDHKGPDIDLVLLAGRVLTCLGLAFATAVAVRRQRRSGRYRAGPAQR